MYKIKGKKVILKARGMLEPAFADTHGVELASFPRPRRVRFLVYFIIRVIFIFLLSLAQHVWHTPVALKGAKFNRVPRETGVAKHAARSQPLSCYPQKG